MRIFDIIIMCWRNLFRRKVRTLLTVTGVIIGTCSIVVMISFGVGIDQYYAQSLSQMGDLTSVSVYNYGGSISSDGSDNGQPAAITDEIITQMASISHVSAITPFYDVWQEGEIKAGSNNRYVYNGTIRGVYLAQMPAFGFTLSEGEWPTKESYENAVIFGQYGAYSFVDTKKKRNNTVWPEVQPDGSVTKPFLDVMTARMNVSARKDEESNKRVKSYDLRCAGVLVEDYNVDYGTGYGLYLDMSLVQKLAADTRRLKGSSGGNQNQDLVYNEVKIKVDDIDNVQSVITAIEDMGYQTSSVNSIREQLQETDPGDPDGLGGVRRCVPVGGRYRHYQHDGDVDL